MTSEAGCWCCGELVVSRVPDPWDGRMDGYCEACSLNRCDCYADECPRSAPRVACATDDCSSRLHKELLEAEAHVTERIETLTAEVARLVVERDAPRDEVAATMVAWLANEYGVDGKLIATLIAILRMNNRDSITSATPTSGRHQEVDSRVGEDVQE